MKDLLTTVFLSSLVALMAAYFIAVALPKWADSLPVHHTEFQTYVVK